MSEIALPKIARQLLEEPILGEADLNAKIRLLLEGEYLRRLRHYRRVDHLLSQKYGMSFEEFMARQLVRQRGYTWEVEKDAMEWETAISGIQTMERKLEELRALE
jgi:hypothetical protein